MTRIQQITHIAPGVYSRQHQTGWKKHQKAATAATEADEEEDAGITTHPLLGPKILSFWDEIIIDTHTAAMKYKTQQNLIDDQKFNRRFTAYA